MFIQQNIIKKACNWATPFFTMAPHKSDKSPRSSKERSTG
jgi:hypothetical protein